jgi:hypothetical protein
MPGQKKTRSPGGERVEKSDLSDSRQPLAPRIGVVVVIIVMVMSKP